MDGNLHHAGDGDGGIVGDPVLEMLHIGVRSGVGRIGRVEHGVARAQGQGSARRGAKDAVEDIFLRIRAGQHIVRQHVQIVGDGARERHEPARQHRQVAHPYSHSGAAGATQPIRHAIRKGVQTDETRGWRVLHGGPVNGDRAAVQGGGNRGQGPSVRRSGPHKIVLQQRHDVVRAVARDRVRVRLRHGDKVALAVADPHMHGAGGPPVRPVRDLVRERLGELRRRHDSGPVDQREAAGGDFHGSALVGGIGAGAQRDDLEYLPQRRLDPIVQGDGQLEGERGPGSVIPLIEHSVPVFVGEQVAATHGDRDVSNVGLHGIRHPVGECLLAEEPGGGRVDKPVAHDQHDSARAGRVGARTDGENRIRLVRIGVTDVVGKNVEHITRTSAAYAVGVRVGIGARIDRHEGDRAGGGAGGNADILHHIAEVALANDPGGGEEQTGAGPGDRQRPDVRRAGRIGGECVQDRQRAAHGGQEAVVGQHIKPHPVGVGRFELEEVGHRFDAPHGDGDRTGARSSDPVGHAVPDLFDTDEVRLGRVDQPGSGGIGSQRAMESRIEDGADTVVIRRLGHETIVVQNSEFVVEAARQDAEGVVTDIERPAAIHDGDHDVRTGRGGTPRSHHVGERQRRETVVGRVHEGVVRQDRLAGDRGRHDPQHSQPGAGERHHAVVGGDVHDDRLARRDSVTVGGRMQDTIHGREDGPDHDATGAFIAGIVPDRVPEIVVADMTGRRTVDQNLSVGDDADRAAVQRGSDANDRHTSLRIGEIAIVGQHVQQPVRRAEGQIEVIVHDKEEAVVG